MSDEQEENLQQSTAHGKREISYTEKGRQYLFETKRRTWELLFGKAERMLKEIQSLTSTLDNVHLVRSNLDLLDQIVLDFQQSHLELLPLIEDVVEKTAIIEQHGIRIKRLDDFLSITKSWVNQAKKIIDRQSDAKSESDGSLASRGSSRRSKWSLKSNSSIQSALAKERAKAAELQAKVEILKRKQVLQNEVEKLCLEEELAVSKAREAVFAQADNELNYSETTSVQRTAY